MKRLSQIGMMAAALAGVDCANAFAQDADTDAVLKAQPEANETEVVGPEPIELEEVVEGLNSFSALTDEVIEGGVGLIFDRSTSSQQEAQQAEADGYYIHETPLPGALKQYLIYIPFVVSSVEDEGGGKVVIYESTIDDRDIAVCEFANATETEEGHLFTITENDGSGASYITARELREWYFEEGEFVYPEDCEDSRDSSWAAAHKHQEALLAAQQPEPPKQRNVALSAEASFGAGTMVDEIGGKYRAWTAATVPLEAGLRLSSENALNGLGLAATGNLAYAASDDMDNGFGFERLGGALSKGLLRGDVDWQVDLGLEGGYSWDPTTDMLDSPYGGLGLEVSREVKPGQSVALKAGAFARFIYSDLSARDNFFNSLAYPGGYAQVTWNFATPDYFDKHGVAPLREREEVATDAAPADAPAANQ